MGVAVTLGAAWIKGSLSQLVTFWDASGEWSGEREGQLGRWGAVDHGSKEARLEGQEDRG